MFQKININRFLMLEKENIYQKQEMCLDLELRFIYIGLHKTSF